MNLRPKHILSAVLVASVMLGVSVSQAVAQSFTKNDITFSPVLDLYTRIEWVDIDLDKKLDAIVSYYDDYNTANNYIAIYHNTTTGFVQITNPFGSNKLIAFKYAVGDYNRDGATDILVLDNVSFKVAVNNKDLTFTVIDLGVSGAAYWPISWYDIDNDSDLEIVAWIANKPLVYANENGSYTQSRIQLPMYVRAIYWADINNDGLADFAGTEGQTSPFPVVVYLNLGEGLFAPQPALPGTPKLYDWEKLQFLDADGDHDLDMLIGNSGNLRLYKNKFSKTGIPDFYMANKFPVVQDVKIDVGDFTRDGQADILMSGPNNSTNQKLILYKNNTVNDSSTFTSSDLGLKSYFISTLQSVDLNGDGALDIFLTGSEDGYSSKAYRSAYLNTTTQNQTAPATPVGLSVDFTNNNAKLSWSPVPYSGALYYNVEILHDGNVYRSSSSLPDGTSSAPRTISKMESTSIQFGNLPPGKYSWRVQAFDEAHRFSEFSGSEIFLINYPPYDVSLTKLSLSKVVVTWTDSLQHASGFSVFRKSNREPLKKIATVAPDIFSYTDDDHLQFDERYEYFIKSEVSGQASAPSERVSFMSPSFSQSFLPDAFQLKSNTGKSIDFDNDGDYDIVTFGSTGNDFGTFKLLVNDGTGHYSIAPFFSNVAQAIRDYEILDIDNDGDEDLAVIAGSYSNGNIQIYRNDSGSWTMTFETRIEQNIQQFALTDFNHDGKLDFFYSRYNNSDPGVYSLFYQNSMSEFTNSGVALFSDKKTETGSFMIEDFDGDGFHDILFSGMEAAYNYPLTKPCIVRNLNGYGFQSMTTNLPLLGNYYFCFDYDGDGKPDIFSMKDVGFLFYRNQGTFQFTSSPLFGADVTFFNGISEFNVADFDLNGLADLFIRDNSGHFTLFKNQGQKGFTPLRSFTSESAGNGVVTDFENDGDVDIIKLGDYIYTPTPIFTNRIISDSSVVVNAVPSIPANLKMINTNNAATISWDAATDDLTPATVLTYNVELKDEFGTIIINAETDGAAKRKLFGPGNAGTKLHYTINDVPAGKYFARVQACDAAYSHSAFSNPLEFSIVHGPHGLTADRILLNKIRLAWQDTITHETSLILERKTPESVFAKIAQLPAGTTEYVDEGLVYNTRYEYRVRAMVGELPTAPSNLVTWNTNFFKFTQTNLPSVYGDVDVGDANADGKMELLIAGYRIVNGEGVDLTNAVTTYENNTWTKKNIGSATIWPQLAQHEFSDINGDNILDIFEYGPIAVGSYKAEIFLGDGSKNYTPSTNFLTAQTNAFQSWFDVDQDNDLDAWTYRMNESGLQTLNLLQNNGNGNFTVASTSNTNCCLTFTTPIVGDFDRDGDEDVFQYNTSLGYGYTLSLNSNGKLTPATRINSSPAFKYQVIDYDNDGWLDLFVFVDNGGYGSYYSYSTRLFRNKGLDANGIPQFEVALDNLPMGDRCDAAWADYDHDGDMDFFISSVDFWIYTNNGDKTFATTKIPDFRVDLNTTKWIDFDDDGDLDLYVTGYLSYIVPDQRLEKSVILENQLIVNQKGIFNRRPSAPINLVSSQNENGMLLTWSAPSDDHTMANALTYDVIVYDKNGKPVTKGPVNPGTGMRLKLQQGRSMSSLIVKLPLGKYTWKVQAIDQSYLGSDLSGLAEFTFLPPAPQFNDTTIYACGRTVTLSAKGQNIEWYSDSALTQVLVPADFHPTSSQTIYLVQLVDGVRSAVNTVNITIVGPTAVPVLAGPNPAVYCNAYTTLTATGSSIRWYSDENKKNLLGLGNTIQVPPLNTDYYFTQSIQSCESLPVKAMVRPLLDSKLYQRKDTIYAQERSATSYQWSVNGGAIPNSNTYYTVMTQSGAYRVTMAKNSCSVISPAIMVTAVQEDVKKEIAFKVYPNPTTSDFTISVANPERTRVSVFDNIGNIKETCDLRDSITTFSTKDWARGIYFIKLDQDGKTHAQKLIIL